MLKIELESSTEPYYDFVWETAILTNR